MLDLSSGSAGLLKWSRCALTLYSAKFRRNEVTRAEKPFATSMSTSPAWPDSHTTHPGVNRERLWDGVPLALEGSGVHSVEAGNKAICPAPFCDRSVGFSSVPAGN